jgi:N-acetylneuraminate synthase/N,N'-diacetyllegionaminate synthase
MTTWHGASPFLIAEIGVNHDGDVARARSMIEEAAAAGFDAVKLQHWRIEELLAPEAPNAPYQGSGDQRDLLAALALSLPDLSTLAACASEHGVEFVCTADGVKALADVMTLAPTLLKIGSGDADNPWLLDAAAATGLPLVVSTGMATDADVTAIVKRLADVRDLALLHCVTAYPTPLAKARLGRIPHLARLTGRPIGFSDHTLGDAAAAAAVALGACIVEKHVTWSRAAPGPDHAASLALADAPEWVGTVRRLAAGLETEPGLDVEAENRPLVRKGLYLAADRPAGHRLTADDLVPLRPVLDGIPASARDELVGRTLVRDVPAGTLLAPADVGSE